MPTLREYATDYTETKLTLLLDVESVLKCFIDATRKYQAWGGLSVEKTLDDVGYSNGVDECLAYDKMPDYEPEKVSENTVITPSEYGIISHLAHLYVERENALMQESSRLAGHEPYGRTSSEVEQDIIMFERDVLPQMAFSSPILTI